jgi:hypothetical protein
MILGREPESDYVLDREFENIYALRKEFINSTEFSNLFSLTVGQFWKNFSGFNDEDVHLLEKYLLKETVNGKEGFITDFLGIRHNLDCLPKNYLSLSGKVLKKLPIPDDSFHSQTIEYVACFTSVENSSHSSYTMLELGAGWGPWMSISGVAAKKNEIKQINLIGVEGVKNKIPFIKKHLTENKLRPESEEFETSFLYTGGEINTKIYDGVVNTDGTNMEFPDVPIDGYGASLVNTNNLPLVNVKGYSLADITKPYKYIDFAHLDLQGYEKELINENIDLIRKKIKYLLIGTHSRSIEGFLIEFLYNNKFMLLREQPCLVKWPDNKPENFINQTTMDGSQFWVNTKCI